jgi:RNA-directed DNA polymerase
VSNERRQEIYDRIRKTSKNAFIREEMVRLGFWPASGQEPGDLATELARQTQIEKELAALRTEASRLQDEAKVLAAVRKQRMAASRQKSADTKARRLQARRDRAAAWKLTQSRTIVYLGASFSGALSQTTPDAEALRKNGLPDFADAGALAQAMGITVGQLRFLTYTRQAATVSHWRRFQVPKKAGGHRLISAPMPRLKSAQHWVLANVLEKVPLHDAAHGFVAGRSIVTNAKPHVGRRVVINLDLQDFFPTVSYARVWGLFRSLGYSPHISTIFALLTTEPPIDEVELDQRTWYVTVGDRVLPQGAPTSPAITNLICRKLDRRLLNVASVLDFHYTRYADDLTFSSNEADSKPVGTLLRRVRHIVTNEGFVVHPKKTKVLRRGRRQEVTGLTVNDQLSVDRAVLRRFRAALHCAETKGPAACTWGAEGVDTLESLMGFANFVHMVDPIKGEPLRVRAKALIARHGVPKRARPVAPMPAAAASPTSPSAAPPPAAPPEAPAAEETDGKKPWWKLW